MIIPIVCSGCADMRAKMVVDGMGPFLEKMKMSMNKSDDFELVQTAMPAGIMQLESFLEISPDNEDILARTAEAYNSYAFAFVEDIDKPRAIKLYQKSKNLAVRALQWNKSFRIDNHQPIDEFNAALKKFKKTYQVPALFYLCSSWLKLLILNPQLDTISTELSQIEAILDRILKINETYHYGGVHALFGCFYAARPSQMGGNLEMARFHFNEAFDISESKYLLWQLLYAKYYAVQMKDKELFISTLNDIISAKDAILQEAIFPNQIAKRKAKALLDHINIYF
jgi:tetratricopeptide (TPR) repeat protein